jgi:RNA 2',3'-cyclic 3'-phosphodiesterase
LRTFIAADLPQEILQKIEKITNYFKTQTPERAVKWVEAEKIHLTIKFIGELQKNKLPAVKSSIQDALQGFSPFKVSVEGLGMFPNASRPRVIWIGIQGGEPLVELHNAIEESLINIGVKPERRGFHPHLTLGRIRRQVSQDEAAAIGQTLSEFHVASLGSAPVNEIVLYESNLTRHGPIYSPIFAFPLHQV